MLTDLERGPRFAIIGTAGFVARRHLDAMRQVGGTLGAACDRSDSAGILDSYFPHAQFFLNEHEFADFLAVPANRVDYLAVCTPSDLHERHAELALSVGADVILEKPPVLEPAGITRLVDLERRYGRRVLPVLQLRYHPEIVDFRRSVRTDLGRLHIVANYVARRGPWYHVSWKGDPLRSGSIVYNLGIHLFDVLSWIFGRATAPVEVWMNVDGTRATGRIEFAGATADWMLSSLAEDLPDGGAETFGWRQFLVDGEVVADYSGDYSGLHRQVYAEVAAGRGSRIGDAYEATLLADQVLTKLVVGGHPLLQQLDRIKSEGADVLNIR